jgi:leucyl-tRNA synthetase
MELNFGQIEETVKANWATKNIYRVENNSQKPKYYVLEMFPYPSGAGLHVGHPLGYIASDIFARYKRHTGFNVLHPMGYDAFGLPAEQYAIETGQHPAVTTEKNIARYREQLDKIGLSYDWSREFKTSDPKYYKWTQWLFLQIFNSWYNVETNKAEPISTLISKFESVGCSIKNQKSKTENTFTAAEWNSFTKKQQADILMQFRLAYLADAEVNWCEVLGTVLANDEVVNGVSERGGHAVVKKKMRQWFLRITEYADRLLEGLDTLDWSQAMKEMQRNWIGKSEGALIRFNLTLNPTSPQHSPSMKEKSEDDESTNIDQSSIEALTPTQKENGQEMRFIEVFTTRPDTIFGCSFLVIAPENELINQITTIEQKVEIEKYVQYVKSRSDVDRMTEKKITGCFTGSYALHPFTKKPLRIYISEYVLNGYGTGAIMAVPSGDSRDYAFAKYFGLPIPNIFEGIDISEKCFEEKTALFCNSDFLDGLDYKAASQKILQEIETKDIGQRKINYKMRDAGFSRQRYWGEPFPIYYENGIAKALPENELPLILPHVASYSPGPEGQGPLANIKEWKDKNLETNTMPGYAGSSWYFLRYMSPNEDNAFVNKEAMKYWGAVDFYNGGSEHAVGHLLYSRLWTKILFDLNHINFEEPFKKMVNQGMITGKSYYFKYELASSSNEVLDDLAIIESFVDGEPDINLSRFKYGHQYVSSNGKLTKNSFEKFIEHNPNDFFPKKINLKVRWENDGNEDYIILKEEVEKMSKSKYNVVNPDDIIAQYGADTFRMYEMFLGPIEVSKPWDTKGIEGVGRFIRKFWNLFILDSELNISTEQASVEENKILHKTIKKVDEDIQKLAYNTCVSQLMICVNELQALKCNKRSVLEPLLILLNPFAPFITEYLWSNLGNQNSIIDEPFPTYNDQFLVESTFTYPIAINGKTRHSMAFDLQATATQIEQDVLANPLTVKYINDAIVKKFIFVKGRMINIVI